MADQHHPPIVPSYATDLPPAVQRSALGRSALSFGHFVIEVAGWMLALAVFGVGLFVATRAVPGSRVWAFAVIAITLLLSCGVVYASYRVIKRIR